MWSLWQRIKDWFNGSAIAQKAVDITVANIKAQEKLLLPIAIEAIKVAAGDSTMSGVQKFASVYNQLATQAPNIQSSMLQTFIQTTYENLKADPNVPEVQ